MNHSAPASRTAPRREALRVAACVLLGVVLAAVYLSIRLWPADGRPMAALFLPGTTSVEALAQTASTGTDARILDQPWANLVIVTSQQPGLAPRLRAAGAWPLDARALSSLCGGAIPAAQ